MAHPGRDVLLAHVDGELQDAEHDDVARHVAGCVVCDAAVIELRTAAGAFAGVLHTLDAGEPEHWPQSTMMSAMRAAQTARAADATRAAGATRAVADTTSATTAPTVLPFRTPLRAPQASSPGLSSPGRGMWRWAAGILLVSGTAASAAILGGRFLADARDAAADATATTAATTAAAATDPNVAIVTVALRGAAVRVALTDGGAGSRVYVALADDAVASVEVEGVDAPHFTAVDGRVDVDLRGAAATVRLTLPHTVQQATVSADGVAIITVTGATSGATVSPVDATVTGVPLGTGRLPRME